MRYSPIFLNLFLVLLTLVIPRISPGDERYGDPILQLLYMVIFLPVMATLLNLVLAKAGKNRWPRITTYLVCVLATVAAYTKWITKTDRVFLQTDSDMTFIFFLLVSVGIATGLFGILHVTGRGLITKKARLFPRDNLRGSDSS